MNSEQKSILLVESDPAERERLAAALEGEGFVVVACSGPSDPDYTCVGGREGYCPLPEYADVVVLDLFLAGDEFELGTDSEQLLDMYLGMGRSVVAIGPGAWSTSPHGASQVRRLGAHPADTDLIGAVRNLPASERFVFHPPPTT